MNLEPMTQQEIEACKQRVVNASPGPWTVNEPLDGYASLIIPASPQTPYGTRIYTYHRDIDFIAHAREDIPRLLAMIESLQRNNESANVTSAEGWINGLPQRATGSFLLTNMGWKAIVNWMNHLMKTGLSFENAQKVTDEIWVATVPESDLRLFISLQDDKMRLEDICRTTEVESALKRIGLTTK